ncbi:MAG: tetratricopeptide repeat-containing sensor histidine kinase, partial [Bacteroidia bacterium]
SYRFNNTKVKIKQGKKDVATEELEKELSDTTSLDQKQKIDMYLELGNLYIEDQKTEEGVELIEKAIDISNKVQSDSIEVVTLNNAWGIYNANGLTAQNFTTQQKALETSEKTNNVSLSSAANYNLGNSYIEENPEIAVSFFEKSVELTKEKPKEVDHIKAVERLSEAYEKSGEYAKALQKYKEYISLVDSIKESEVAGRLRNELLSTKYKIQESKIHELELKQDQKEQAIKTQRNTILGLIMGLLILLGLTYFLVKNIRQKQRSNTLIQLASLRSQMNPHFIFNSLNSVNGFISQNEEIKANRYISDFSKLMRTVLNNSNSPTIPLQDELKSLEIYMALEHSRFEDKFDYEINIDSSIDTLQ